jgi:hypothetical protein
MPHWGKMTGEYEVLSGFLIGVIIWGGLLIWIVPGIFWPITGPVLVLFGVLLLFDDAYPYGRQPHLTSESGGFLAGFVVVLVSAIYNPAFVPWVLAVAVFFSAIKLLIRLLKKLTK